MTLPVFWHGWLIMAPRSTAWRAAMKFAGRSKSNARHALPAAGRAGLSVSCRRCRILPAISMSRRAAQRTRRRGALLRHHFAAPDINAVGFQRSIRLLDCAHDRNMRARLQLTLIGRYISPDDSIGRHHYFLFAVLIFDHHDLTAHARNSLIDGSVGHRAVWPRVPRPMPLAQPALRLG